MSFLNILRPDMKTEKEVTEKQPEEMIRTQSPTSMDEQMKNFSEKYSTKDVPAMNELTGSEIFTNTNTTVKICVPRNYEDVQMLGQAIKEKKVVILNLEKLESSLAKRILEFVYGACFMEDIAIERIDDQKIFLIDSTHKIG